MPTPIRQFGLVRLGILLFCLLCLSLCVQAAEAKRPNFLFIIADDQSPFDLKVY